MQSDKQQVDPSDIKVFPIFAFQAWVLQAAQPVKKWGMAAERGSETCQLDECCSQNKTKPHKMEPSHFRTRTVSEPKCHAANRLPPKLVVYSDRCSCIKKSRRSLMHAKSLDSCHHPGQDNAQSPHISLPC